MPPRDRHIELVARSVGTSEPNGSTRSRRHEAFREAAGILGFFLAYVALAEIGYRISFGGPGSIATWWPASGLALAVLLRNPTRRWPVLFAAVALAASVPTSIRGFSTGVVVVRVLADLVEPLIGASLLRWTLGPTIRLDRLRQVIAFALFGGVAGPFAGTTVVLLGYTVIGVHTSLALAVAWWASAASAVIGLAPVILTLPRGRPHLPSTARLVEASLLTLNLALVSLAVFSVRTTGLQATGLAFAVFPLLGWAALRFGPPGAARTAAALVIFTAWGTVIGSGPFDGKEPIPFQVIATQLFLAIAVASSLVLAAISAEGERLRAEAHTQARRNEESLALLHTLLRSAPVGFAFVDLQLRIQQSNETFAALGSEPAQTLIGRPIGDALAELASTIEPLIYRTLATGEPIVGQAISRDEPERRHWLWSSYPVRLRSGPVVGIGVVVIDVTERIEAEQERARLFREAEEAIRIRDEFLSIASHELKTPLTPLAARLQALHTRAVAGGPVDAVSLEKARRSLARLTWLINDLLDASRIGSARLTLQREPVSLAEVARSVADALRSASARHAIVVDLPQGEVQVAGDRQRLEQVLSNLVDNAIKYSPGGGTIRIALEVRGEEAVLSVTDPGIGIPADQQRHLFERFFRARNAAATSYGGLGLGLYISRDIVERHGGRIWVESEPGRGSTFRVALPLPRAAEKRGTGLSLH